MMFFNAINDWIAAAPNEAILVASLAIVIWSLTTRRGKRK